MLKTIFILILTSVFSLGYSQQYISSQLFKNIAANPASYINNPVEVYKILYTTPDINGNLDTASGAVAVPILSNCNGYPTVVYCHGTIFEKQNVPSNGHELDVIELIAGNGALSIAPDYLGMGESRGIHPYLHAKTEATATIDFIRASRYFFDSIIGLRRNNEIFITGYSQGGHAAMATHKYIQDSSLYNEFNVIGSGPNSGPYDVSGATADTIFSASYYQFQGFIPYLINSMDMVYNLYDSTAQYFKAPYHTYVQEWIDGTRTLTNLDNLLPSPIGAYLEDSIALDFRTNPNSPLRIALSKQNVYQWAPTRPVKMGYCEADHLVPYTNALKARDTMNAYGATNVTASSHGPTNNHFGCAQPSMQDFGLWILSNATKCGYANIEEYLNQTKFIVYPNPSSAGEKIQLIYNQEINYISIINVNGQLVDNIQVNTTAQNGKIDINTANFNAGVYTIISHLKNNKLIHNRIQIIK